jgi:lipopolysaccharide/colanic/teichoic acid biosynthesis glycosyltransferase
MTTFRLGRSQDDDATLPAGARLVGRVVKRLLDLVVAAALLLLCLPLLLVVWAAVRLTSPGPALFHQSRVGQGGQPFQLLKFRTMVVDGDDTQHREYVRRLLTGAAEPQDGLYKLGADPRVTRAGAVLRKTSIDELPQLFNVLRGEMSLVGPRPALPWEARMFPAWAASRFSVRPGLTGLWQVSGRNRLTMLDGLVLDVDYVSRHNVFLDLYILVRTVPAVLNGGAR